MRIVQKFGGSSLKNPEYIQQVAERIAAVRARGHALVIVVSAMGDTTDGLLDLAHAIQVTPEPRTLDFLLATGEMQSAALMAMALAQQGVPAVALTGAQAGVRTDSQFGQARIHQVLPEALERWVAQGVVPVVTGFQGMDGDGALTTLGRGGSDLTAIALASAIHADACEIYSDVAGVFTADPRVVADAKALRELSYDDMLELASQGAQVLQTQAVLYARQSSVTVQARSTFDDHPGTRISRDGETPMGPVTGVALDMQVAKIGLVGVPDRPGVAAFACERLAVAGINIDLVFQALTHHDRRADIALTVATRDQGRAVAVCQETLAELGGRSLLVDSDIAKVSAVGAGVRNHAGAAAGLFRAFADAGINIQMISTSEIKISCIIARADAHEALNAAHQAFDLGTD